MCETTTVILLVLLFGVILFLVTRSPTTSGFTISEPGNAEYQNSTPNKTKQWLYNECVVKECGGDTNDYSCQQRCRLKMYRAGMEGMDTQEWACWQYGPQGTQPDERKFYECLGSAYADYKYP